MIGGTRGIILTPTDLGGELDWPKLAHEAGLTAIATHIGPEDVIPFLKSERGIRFLDDCKRYGLEVEHELHAMSYLLPRAMFDSRPELFRMNEHGVRVREGNCCASSDEALAIIAENAVEVAKVCRPTTGRYFYWLDDNSECCKCPGCAKYNASEQALIVENAILTALREKIAPRATLAHLAYQVTMDVPTKVKPRDGIFLEYAPIDRDHAKFLGENEIEKIRQLLTIFPVDTAQVLEYWLDASLFSKWHKPSVRLPWDSKAFRRDIKGYRNLGFRNFTTFGVYLDDDYVKAYGDLSPVLDYGRCLNEILP